MEEDIQEKFHRASVDQIRSCQCEPTSTEPLPREITTVFRFPDPLLSIIEEFQSELKSISPSLFYYPRDQFHLTILGNLPLTTDLFVFETVIQEFLKLNSFSFRFWGAGMGKFSSSISAYPVNFSLHELRMTLRERLKISGTNFTIHLPEYEYVGWINFARNVGTIPDEKYRSTILKYVERDFGIFSPKTIECIENESWVIDPKQSKVIKQIKL